MLSHQQMASYGRPRRTARERHTVSIAAHPGDVVVFSYYLICWSDVNRTDQWRKPVRIGHHTSATRPEGKAADEPSNSMMVGGVKQLGKKTKFIYR